MKNKIFMGTLLVLAVVCAGAHLMNNDAEETKVDLPTSEEKRPGIASITKVPNGNRSAYADKTELVGEEIPIDTVLFRYAYRMRVNGDRAVIMDLHNMDNHCHVFTFPDFKYLSSFAPIGEGPNEFLVCNNVRLVGKDSVWAIDNIKNRMMLYSGIAEGTKPVLEKELKLDKRLFRALEFDHVGDKAIIPDYSGEYRFCWTDMNTGKMTKGFQRIPVDDPKLLEKDSYGVALGWHSFISFTPDKRKLVAANQFGDRVDIYDMQSGMRTTWLGKGGSPTFRETGSGGLWYTSGLCHYDLQVTDKYIYTVFDGRSFGTIMKEGEENKQGGRLFRIYTHEADMVKEIVLDRRIAGIYVDEATNTLYGLDVNADEQIVKWKL